MTKTLSRTDMILPRQTTPAVDSTSPKELLEFCLQAHRRVDDIFTSALTRTEDIGIHSLSSMTPPPTPSQNDQQYTSAAECWTSDSGSSTNKVRQGKVRTRKRSQSNGESAQAGRSFKARSSQLKARHSLDIDKSDDSIFSPREKSGTTFVPDQPSAFVATNRNKSPILTDPMDTELQALGHVVVNRQSSPLDHVLQPRNPWVRLIYIPMDRITAANLAGCKSIPSGLFPPVMDLTPFRMNDRPMDDDMMTSIQESDLIPKLDWSIDELLARGVL